MATTSNPAGLPHKIRADGGTFRCPACNGQHQRYGPVHDDADDGIEGGQGRPASALRDGYVAFTIALVGIVCILVGAVVVAINR